MGVLDVVDGILVATLAGQVDVDLDRLVVAAVDEVPARRVDADLVQQLVEEDDVAASLRHLPRLAVLGQVDELIDEYLDPCGVVPDHRRERLEPRDVSVVIRTEHVDRALEPSELVADVRRVAGEVRRLAARPDEDAILVVPVRARPRPHRPVGLVGIELGDRRGNLVHDLALPLPTVDADTEANEDVLDPANHRGDGIAVDQGKLIHVRTVVAVGGRVLPTPASLDRRSEPIDLGTRVVEVVLLLDGVAGEGRADAPRRRRRHRSAPSPRSGARSGSQRRARPGSAVTASADPAPKPSPAASISARASPYHAGPTVRLRNPGPATSTRSYEVAELRERRQFGGDVARWTTEHRSKAESDSRREIAVLGIARPLEGDFRRAVFRQLTCCRLDRLAQQAKGRRARQAARRTRGRLGQR